MKQVRQKKLTARRETDTNHFVCYTVKMCVDRVTRLGLESQMKLEQEEDRHSVSPHVSLRCEMCIDACLPTLENNHYPVPDEAVQTGYYWRRVQFYTRTPLSAVNPHPCATCWLQWMQNQPRQV